MARPNMFKENISLYLKMDRTEYDKLGEIATLESTYSGRLVTMQQLIRNAIKFTYEDNERLRECFRRTRCYSKRRKKLANKNFKVLG